MCQDFVSVSNLGNDQVIEFQEIKINVFHEIETFYKIDQEIETLILQIVQEIKKTLGVLGG
jgi:ABC-type branched-subunit amino acid transport system substrate-binding protein